MKGRSFLPGTAAALGMLVLILDSKTAFTGAAEGIRLCLWTVVPSLFPFFFLSGILVSGWMGAPLPLLSPVGRLLGIPKGAESLLICGFLGGYPVGAKSIGDAWASGGLSRRDAVRMLSFCSNAGPAFLFGMAAPLFSDPKAAWVLWGIHIVSALVTGILFRESPGRDSSSMVSAPLSIPNALDRALRVTAGVCGWIVIFRIVCAFMERWALFLLPDWGRTAFACFLELANGCAYLKSVSSESMRFLLCSMMLSSGGICVAMQTASVTRGLSLKYYFAGKVSQTLISILLSMVYLQKISWLWLVPVPLLLLQKTGKKSGNPRLVGV